MSQIKLIDALKLFSLGGWILRSCRVKAQVEERCILVTLAQIEGTTLVLRNGDVVIAKHPVDRLVCRIDSSEQPNRMTFDGLFTVRQQRRRSQGGGHQDAERVGRLMSLELQPAKTEQSAQGVKARGDHLSSQRVTEIVTPQGVAKCDVVYWDRTEPMRDRYAVMLDRAIQERYDGTHSPSITYVKDTGCDQAAIVVSSLPITRQEAQLVWDRFMQLDRALT